ncbi:MAG: DUF4091 domain-containing protein [Clostridia bacterium]|nr:DUF4091 domain-containing protein [Clostridia bacterium]
MSVITKQISSLEKIYPDHTEDVNVITETTVLRGECFSYQIAVFPKSNTELSVEVVSPLKESVKLYSVKNAVADYPVYDTEDSDYITKTPSLMPDILVPLEQEKCSARFASGAGALWISVTVPEDAPAGKCPVTVKMTEANGTQIEETLYLHVIAATVPKQRTLFTQWFHVDCIADIHNVEIYSEEHWRLIDKYMSLACELGINMLLTPVITPPLDTAVGTRRPCTQLVRIEKQGEKYVFDFSLLKRWIDLCLKNGIKYFEISHLFSQWGLKCAPNIKITENGEEHFAFGWHVDARSEEYKDFLAQFLPTLVDFLEAQGVKDRCWFHISDEPSSKHFEAYEYAHGIVEPLIRGCRTLDAISDYGFYEKGLIPNPVTAINKMEPFIQNDAKNRWAYYCCSQYNKVSNRFLAMPAYRTRIIGLQLYKFDIVGFLHWGYNFYYNQYSRRMINPYITTSADKAFPSGDPFSVYPTADGAIPSLRAVVFKEALMDVEICRMLEGYIGREAVIRMIDDAAGMELTFAEYPRNSQFVPQLIEKMVKLIEDHAACGL